MKEATENKYQIVAATGMGFLTTLSISMTGKYVETTSIFESIRQEIDGTGMDKVVILIALSIFYYKCRDRVSKVTHWTIYLLAILFSVFMLIGMSFSQNGNLDFVLEGKKQMLISFVVAAGFFLLFEMVLRLMYLYLDTPGIKNVTVCKTSGKIRKYIECHYTLSAFGIILICWIPWWIIQLPGSIPYDGCNQLLQAFGERTLTDLHSWVMTLFMGFLMRIGQHVSDNFGIFLITAALFLFELFCYVISCRIVNRWKLPFLLKIILPIFYGIVPLFGVYAQTIIKDSPFMAAFTLYMTIYIDTCLLCCDKIVVNNRKFQVIRNVAFLLVVGYLVCIIRNNGAYLVIPAAFFLIFLLRKGFRRYAVLLLAGSFMLVWVHGNIFAPAAGVHSQSVSTRGMLYMQFQIAGRYMREYPEDLTDSEREILDTVFKDYETLGEAYTPNKADAVKARYRSFSNTDNLRSFETVVLSMIKKHPLTCFEAVLNQSYGYYYPFYNCEVMPTYCNYIIGKMTQAEEVFDIYYITPESIRNEASEYAELWTRFPGLAQLMSPAFPVWILLFAGGYLAYRKKWKAILVLAAPSINMVICILSPVNGCIRYAMPATACLLQIIYWMVQQTQDSEMTNELCGETI